MVRRVARNGPRAGNPFWGCSTFPRCKGIVNIGDEPVTTDGSVESSPAAAAFRPRVTWSDSATRPGWGGFYAPAGGRLRSWDPVADREPTVANALSSAAVYVAEGSTAPGVPGDVSRVVDVLRRILTRGDRPPVDPMVEQAILEAAGLATAATPSRDPGDASVRLGATAALPDRATVDAAVAWREQFSFDDSARLATGGELLGSHLEREFIHDLVPRVFGSSAGHWFHPQTPMAPLIGSSDDHRRVDFLVHHPAVRPHVVELDGAQHEAASEVDHDRDQALAAAGIVAERATIQEMDRLGESELTPLREPVRPPDQTLLLVWGPVVAHRVARGIVEAIAAGWLDGSVWRIRVTEPLGIGSIAVRSAVELITAVAGVWNAPLAPQKVTLDVGGEVTELHRVAPGTYEPATADAAVSALDTEIIVEPFAGPWHLLPEVGKGRIVIRSAPLPVLLREGRLEGGERSSVVDVDRMERATLERLLTALFAKREFYPAQSEHPRGQEVAIRRVLTGKDTAVLLPTGAGKSLIYQFASLLLPGRTLIIDPIIALIDDQLDGLAAQGIDRAIGITRADNADNVVQTKLQAIANGDALFCFVAPERLQQRKFRDAIRALTVASPINLCVVDEAHCVSEWGHDFRTAYLDIGRVLREASADVAGNAPPILALTGTASRSVLRDMLIELDIDRSDPEAIVQPQDFDRPELTFSVIKARDDEAVTRLLGTVRSLPARFGIPEGRFFHASGPDTYSGIVFSQTVNPQRTRPDGGLLNLQAALEVEFDVAVGLYSGSRPKAWKNGDWDRAKRQMAADFKGNRLPVLVATKAYGMGIDKPNVRYIIHAGVSGSIEAYYQEAGRAGRDRQRSHCVIVHDDLDRGFWDFAHGSSFGGTVRDAANVAAVLELIGKVGERRTVFVPRSAADQASENQERAIHRLKLLGVVRDYLVDWGGAQFEVLLAETDPELVDRAFLQYVRRTQPGRVKAYERELAGEPVRDLRGRILSDAGRLIAFIYETVVNSRHRALNEMVRLAEEATSDEEIRGRILAYLELGQVASDLEPLVDAPEFSFEPWQSLYHEIHSVDDAREWRGATARFLESSPDHPGLLIGRALAEVVATDGNPTTFAENLQAGLTSATATYLMDADATAEFTEWLLLWLHERRSRWGGLGFLAAEHSLGAGHLDFLIGAETEILRDRRTNQADELAMVLSRRTDRMAAALVTLADRARELTA